MDRPPLGSKWINRRTGATCTVVYHPSGLEFWLRDDATGRQHVYHVSDDPSTLASRFELATDRTRA